jgi:hypothetical protein
MVRKILLCFSFAAPCLLAATPAYAHENWVSKGRFKNTAGEWCCNAYDCKSYQQIASTPQGWMIGAELVPFDEAMPVPPPDGQLTRFAGGRTARAAACLGSSRATNGKPV